jgi:3-phenylpropionate/trans-cinnamate dioxygenase ferredoxin subunit
MSEAKLKWYKIALSIEELPWKENNLAVVEAGGKKVTIARHENNVFACAYQCPHASGILSEGFIDRNGNLICPVHRYKFSLLNGRNVTGEGYFLNTYDILNNEDGIYVGFEDTSLLRW